MGWLL